jgi:hypothetical protein
MKPKTRVITVRGKDRAALLADPSFVYVGRSCAGWRGSLFGNPFRLRRWADPWRAVEAYEEMARLMLNRPVPPPGTAAPREVLAYARAVAWQAEVPRLRGKTLGCWCGDWTWGEPPIPCHAVVLARLAEEFAPAAPALTGPPGGPR